MTIVSVSRKKICDAIAKEPATSLAAGSWVDATDEDKVRSRNCSVCAVGAVMRNALLDRGQAAWAIDDAAHAAVKRERVRAEQVVRGNPKKMAARGAYMGALSTFFETEAMLREVTYMGTDEKARIKATRQLKKDCIKFIEENFPARIEIDIDGALPAKDVKVVSR